MVPNDSKKMPIFPDFGGSPRRVSEKQSFGLEYFWGPDGLRACTGHIPQPRQLRAISILELQNREGANWSALSAVRETLANEEPIAESTYPL